MRYDAIVLCKNSIIKAWVLCWCQKREIVICCLLALVKLKETQFPEVIKSTLIEIGIRSFLFIAAL